MIKTRPSKSTSVLTSELDTVFSEWVRINESDSTGHVNCFITGVRMPWRMADASHYHGRQHVGTRWHENNVHACSIASNRFDESHLDQYRVAMMRVYKPIQLTLLDIARRSIQKFTKIELEDKILHYKEEVKKLRALKKI